MDHNAPTPANPLRIVIVGGGTAGWMTAALMAQHWGVAASVTVVESVDIGIIGVGEGSTPQLKAFFDRLGIAEAEWMPACNATYKAGIRFAGWSDRAGYSDYFHPFSTALDGHTAPSFFFHTRARRSGRDVWAHPDRFFLSEKLAAKRLAPVAAENFPFDIGYGYHFDAVLVGRFLRQHCVERLGVVHLERTVADVRRDLEGELERLNMVEGDSISGDFFVDASGFRGLLIQQALGEPFRPFAENLFNNSAIAIPTEREAESLSCETKATALAAGWAWQIPLTNRYGNGYVYASDFKSKDAAEAELRAHLGIGDKGEARHLSMNVGRVERSWVKNCLAVGLSQGFIEPLEATALHIVQATVEQFCAAYDAGTDAARDQFNQRIAARYEGIRDYIVCHYKVNHRRDDGTARDYWRANAANQHLSDTLKAVLTSWYTAGELDAEIARLGIATYYAPLSWHCLLAGYGTFPEDAKLTASTEGLPLADMAVIDDFVERCSRNFPDHAAHLAALTGA